MTGAVGAARAGTPARPLLFAALVVGIVALPLLWPAAVPAALDLWRGASLLHSHALPHAIGAESFAADGHVSGYVGWLGLVLLAALDALGGAGALALGSGALFAVALVLVAVRTLALGSRPAGIVAIAAMFTVAALAGKASPIECAALALLAATLVVLEHPDRRWALLCIPIALVLGNLDARGLFVPAIALVFAAGRAISDGAASPAARRLALIGLASLAATCATPYGFDLALRAGALLGLDRSYADLWQPASLAPLAYWLCLVPLYGAATLGGLWRRERAAETLLALGALILALASGRYLADAVLVTGPIVAASLLRRRDALGGVVAISYAGLASAFVLCAGYLSGGALRDGAAPRANGGVASAQMSDGRQHRIACVPVALCDAFVSRGDPLLRVLMDGRLASYPASVRDDQAAIEQLRPEWRARVRAWRIDALVVQPGLALAQILELSPSWRRAGSSVEGVIFRSIRTQVTVSRARPKAAPLRRPQSR